MTQTIPTDKRGNVYYGPKTLSEAIDHIYAGRSAKEVEGMLRKAGYTGVADRVRAKFEGGVHWQPKESI
jgi:hypothetical protein